MNFLVAFWYTHILMNYSSQVVSEHIMKNIILKCQRDNQRPLLWNRMLRMIKKLINNMFRMDMCDTICKMHEHTLRGAPLSIVPRLVTFTREHWTSKTGQSVPGWWLGGDPGVWILLPFRNNLDPQNLDTMYT